MIINEKKNNNFPVRSVSQLTRSPGAGYQHIAGSRSTSYEKSILPATVTTVEKEGDGMVWSTWRERYEDYSVLLLILKLKLRQIREQNASLRAVANEYKVRVKTIRERDARENNDWNHAIARVEAVIARSETARVW